MYSIHKTMGYLYLHILHNIHEIKPTCKRTGQYRYSSPGTQQALQWRHNELAGVSNQQPHDCLLNRLFMRRSKKTSKLRVTGLCVGNSPGTGESPAQRASNAKNVSIWWRHHDERVMHVRLGHVAGVGVSVACRYTLYTQRKVTLRHEQNGRHFAANIFKSVLLSNNWCILIQISSKFVTKVPINNLSTFV